MKLLSFVKFHHEDQYRANGESYVYHPVRVGRAIEDFGLEQRFVTVAMLHDVLEMTTCKIRDIEHIFGAQVAEMVAFLSKKPKEFYSSKYNIPVHSNKEDHFNDHPLMYSERVNDYVAKIEEGSKKYPEILIIKMCDQLDNLKDCSVFSTKKMTRIVEIMTLLYIPLYKRSRSIIPDHLLEVFDLLFERFLERLEIVRTEYS